MRIRLTPLPPAELRITDVEIGGTTGCPVDLSIGDNVSGITMSGVQLAGGGLGLLYFATTGGLDLGDTSFATGQGFIFNATPFLIDATHDATFSGVTTAAVPFTNFDTSTGDPTDPADLDKYFAIEDNIIDAIDVTGAGLVRLKSGYQFVSNNSTENASFQLLVPTMSSIQNAVNASGTGETIHVQSGTYNGVVDILTTGIKLIGAGQGSTIITYNGLSNSQNGGIGIAADDVEIRDLTIDGAPSSSASPRYGLKVNPIGIVGTDRHRDRRAKPCSCRTAFIPNRTSLLVNR